MPKRRHIARFLRGSTCDSPTLAERLCYLPTHRLRRELDDFRIRYERRHGATDLTQPYTSMLPTVTQLRLLQQNPARYFHGLPAFVQSFVHRKMCEARHSGELDDMPATFIHLFLSGGMAGAK